MVKRESELKYCLRRALDQLIYRGRRIYSGGPKASRIALRWEREIEIEPGDRLCLFVLLPCGNELLPHSVDHVAAWRAAGYKVVVVVAATALEHAIDLSPLDAVEGLVVRLNKGYDFGAWAAAISSLGMSVRNLTTLALANDSVLGPSNRFEAMIDEVDRSAADLIGLIENQQVRPHFQSFALFFKPRALRDKAFDHFWGRIRSGDRSYVVDFYETTLLATFAGAGLRSEALFAAPGWNDNPTLTGWRELIDEGFPYIKIQLFRDNPAASALDDWQDVAERGGFDVARVERQVAALKRHSGSRWHV